MFYCNTGRCIPAELKCDRFNHCEDNSDESNDNCLRKTFCWINQTASVVHVLGLQEIHDMFYIDAVQEFHIRISA